MKKWELTAEQIRKWELTAEQIRLALKTGAVMYPDEVLSEQIPILLERVARAAQLKLVKWMITEQRPYEELVAEVKAALEEK